jgi:pimeloyl-ACP methyl ester carboxylesterase
LSRCAAAALVAALMSSPMLSPSPLAAPADCAAHDAAIPVVHYRTAMVDGVEVFYREAGPADAPVVLLLHGFPTSSHMFRNLIPALADRYHVIAPDYPGFGQSAAPDHKQFAYTFAHYAEIVDGLLAELGVEKYAVYLMDYGAPVGYRLALKHPERVTALIVQNGNAYEEGLKAFWDPIKAYWADGSEAHRAALAFLVAPETTKFQYVAAWLTFRASTLTTGAMTSRCSTGPATRTSSSTSSTIMGPTSRSTRNFRRSSASGNRPR